MVVPGSGLVKEQAEEESPAEEQPSDSDRLKALWIQQSQGCKAKNKAEVDKFLQRFANTLRNQGIEESEDDRASREKAFIESRKKTRGTK